MTDIPAVDLREGERIGPYRLEAPIGSGGMGTVWRAWDERLRRHVAVKRVLRDSVARSRERLRREARAAARLSHPAIVHIYDLLESDGADWIVMELVSGESLRQLLDREGGLEVGKALQLGREIAEGLAEAHAQGILHRDLKTANIMVTAAGRAKILDFGLAKVLHGEGHGAGSVDPSLSATEAIVGTCFAMSPEQVLGNDLDARSDLFSLGSLLYETLTGGAPFRAENSRATLARVLHRRPRPLHEVRPDVPLGLSRLIELLLEKEPADRPASAGDVCEVLTSLATGLPKSASCAASATAETIAVGIPLPSASGSRGADSESTVGGERRTVTVVSCALAQAEEPGALDLEVLSDAMNILNSLARAISRELSGSLGAVLSRTLWLCFGYPQAHEDDAERAVRAVGELQARFAALPFSAAHRLAVRAGVHTGSAVVTTRSSMGEALQPGETVEIAMAIQGQVPAGRIAVSAATRRLLWRKFVMQPLPAVHLKDLGETIAVYELGPPLEPGSRDGRLPPLVNREAELQILLDRFRLASSGSGQAVLISGEAGIGKSRLVQALSEQLEPEAPIWLMAHGSAFAQNTPLAPIIDLLKRALFAAEGGVEGSAEERLRRLEESLDAFGLPRPDYVPLLGALLSLPTEERYPALLLSPEARRKRMLAAVLALLGAMAERQPMVLVIEDLHWIDPSTRELLDLLLGELPMLSLLLVCTFRPELTAPLSHQTSATRLGLGRLSESHAMQLVRQVSEGKDLPAEMLREIVVRTDGIPLFAEELTNAVLETEGSLRGPASIPFTLGSSLLARLDRLEEAKAVAQLAAVIGRTFSLELLEAFSWIKGAALRSAVGRLVQAEILYRRGPAQGARYFFKHALIQDTAYLSLLASDRQQLHQRLARLLQEDFPAVAEAEPELMAYHCEHGGLTVETVDYLLRAGQRAMQRSAALEAVSHLTRALDLLPALPETPERLRRELDLRSVLGPVLGAIKGWGASEVGANAGRCIALCRELGDHGRLIPALHALRRYHLLRGDSQPVIDLADEIARLAKTPVEVFMGCTARAQTAFERGRFVEALALTEQATALFEPNLSPEFARAFGEESSLGPHIYQFWALCILGKPDTAVRKRDAVLATAESLRAPFLLGMALLFEMFLWYELRNHEQVAGVAERLMRLASEQEFALIRSFAHVGKGWAACQRGELAGGTALIEKGIALHEATGAQLPRRYLLSYLLQAHLVAGRLAEGLAAAREISVHGENRLGGFLDAKLIHLQGELLRACGHAGEAEAIFRKALDIARRQGALTFELRAATGLGRLLRDQGRIDEARQLVAGVYGAFQEGFETRDLQDARELLGELR